MISLCMLVKDPPLDRLAALLDYLGNVVGERIIVVDDRTAPEARAVLATMGTLVDFTWIDDFAAARNAALPYVTGDWVLHLDPDELPSHAMMDFLMAVDHSEWRVRTMWNGDEHNDPQGYLFWTRNYWDGTQGEEYEEHWHCRLFRAQYGEWYKPVHEQVMLGGIPESHTRETPLMMKAPRGARLIHSRMNNRQTDEQYASIEVSNA